MSVNASDGVAVNRLRKWLKERNPKLTDSDLDLDRDLIENRLLDSLSALDFILYIEELANCEIDTSAPDSTSNLRTLRTIRDVYFFDAQAFQEEERPSSRRSLSALPPKLGDAEAVRLSTSTIRRPLTHSQTRYWYMQQARPETAFNVPAVLRIQGPLNTSILRQCLTEVVRRHDGLRTKFEVIDGVPMQVLVPPFTPEMPVITVSEATPSAAWDAALKLVETECAKPCDLTKGPPWYVRLVRMSENDHVCFIALEHLIADLESLLTIPRELARLYAAFGEQRQQTLPVPPMQFSDFSDWHRDWLETAGAKEEIAFRKEQFADARPIDFGNGRGTATRSPREGAGGAVPLEITTRLEALAADERATPVAVVMSAVATMLHRRFRQSDIVLMMVSSYRSVGRRTTGVIGNFTNQVPLRITVTPNMKFRELLQHVRGLIVEGIKYRDVPTQLIFDTENPLDHPLAAVLVNWMNLIDYVDGMSEVQSRDTVLKPVMLGVGEASHVPLHGGDPPFATLIVRAVRSSQGAGVFVTTATEVLPAGLSKDIAQEITTLLTTVAANPDVLVGA